MINAKRRAAHQPQTSSTASQTAVPARPYTVAEANQPVERIGDILRRAREQRGDDLQPIADYLCIRRSYLEAIEGSRYEEFPADAYVIGFLRSYANLLGLDGRQAIERYRREMAGRRRKPALSMPTPMTEGRTPNAVIMIAAFIGAFLIYMVWYGLSSSDRATVSHPPALPTVTAAADLATAPETTTLTEPLPLPSTSPLMASPEVSAPTIPAAPRLTLRADQASWVLVSDSQGHTVYDHVMKAGETYRVPDIDGLTLTSGNSSGIVLTLNGIDLPRLSSGPGRTVKAVPLDTASLKSQYATGKAE